MPFIPNTRLLKFTAGPLTEAWQYLHKLQSPEPETCLRQAYPLASPPAQPPKALDQIPLPHGPIAPTASCPQSGQTLRLHIFRDLTAVMLRETAEGGLEVLPAPLVLASQAWDSNIKDVPFLERVARVACLQLQGRPDGLYWKMRTAEDGRGAIDAETLTAMIAQVMREIAETILSAGPVADPRAYLAAPEGARFAPYAAWPEVDRDSPEIARLEAAARAVAAIRGQASGRGYDEIIFNRQLPHEPWRSPTRRPVATSSRATQSWSERRDKELDRALRQLLEIPELSPPDNLRFGPENKQLLCLKNCGVATSSHEALAHFQVLRDLAPEVDLKALMA